MTQRNKISAKNSPAAKVKTDFIKVNGKAIQSKVQINGEIINKNPHPNNNMANTNSYTNLQTNDRDQEIAQLMNQIKCGLSNTELKNPFILSDGYSYEEQYCKKMIQFLASSNNGQKESQPASIQSPHDSSLSINSSIMLRNRTLETALKVIQIQAKTILDLKFRLKMSKISETRFIDLGKFKDDKIKYLQSENMILKDEFKEKQESQEGNKLPKNKKTKKQVKVLKKIDKVENKRQKQFDRSLTPNNKKPSKHPPKRNIFFQFNEQSSSSPQIQVIKKHQVLEQNRIHSQQHQVLSQQQANSQQQLANSLPASVQSLFDSYFREHEEQHVKKQQSVENQEEPDFVQPLKFLKQPIEKPIIRKNIVKTSEIYRKTQKKNIEVINLEDGTQNDKNEKQNKSQEDNQSSEDNEKNQQNQNQEEYSSQSSSKVNSAQLRKFISQESISQEQQQPQMQPIPLQQPQQKLHQQNRNALTHFLNLPLQIQPQGQHQVKNNLVNEHNMPHHCINKTKENPKLSCNLYIKNEFKSNLLPRPDLHRLVSRQITFLLKKIPRIKDFKDSQMLRHSNIPMNMEKFVMYSWNSLLQLEIYNCEITSKGFQLLLKIAPQLYNLQYLNASSNSIQTIRRRLSQLKNLKYLNLEDNPLNNLSIDYLRQYQNVFKMTSVVYNDNMKRRFD